jgi:hypothetical protein
MDRINTVSSLGSAFLVGALLASCTAPAMAQPGSPGKIILGQTAVVDGSEVSTWARVNDAGHVIWVGLTIPLDLVENMPNPGSGPTGAIAVLEYPAVVQAASYFNHAEIHSQPNGHPTNPAYADATRYSAPHFDFHFYAIPESEVRAIPFGFFFDEVAADQLPKFYAQPEPLSVPEMGRHAAPLSEFTATEPWQATMLAGFLPDASYMHLVEPMATRELLLQRRTFVMRVPRPATIGRATQYPAELWVSYDSALDAYHLVFTGFHSVD